MVFTNRIHMKNSGINVGCSCVDVCIQTLRKEMAEKGDCGGGWESYRGVYNKTPHYHENVCNMYTVGHTREVTRMPTLNNNHPPPQCCSGSKNNPSKARDLLHPYWPSFTTVTCVTSQNTKNNKSLKVTRTFSPVLLSIGGLILKTDM